MKNVVLILFTILLTIGFVFADSVNIPNSFTSGTAALASEVNENFTAIENAVDDNDSRIDDLEADFTSIPIVNIVGAAGLDYRTFSSFISISGSTSTMYNMGSLTVSCPTSGYVLVLLTGDATFFHDSRTVEVGVSSTTSSFAGSTNFGHLDGTGTQRYYESFTAMAVIPVSAGNRTFYALARGNTTFDSGSVNVSPRYMAAIFIPNRY